MYVNMRENAFKNKKMNDECEVFLAYMKKKKIV